MTDYTYLTARTTYINARALVLQALDILDRFYHVGKYKRAEPLTIQPTDSIATAAIMETVTEQAQKGIE